MVESHHAGGWRAEVAKAICLSRGTRPRLLFLYSLLVLLLGLGPLGLKLRAEDRVLEEGPPESAGVSAAALQAGMKLFHDAVNDDELTGGVVLVARRGTIVLHEAFGWRNKEESLPMEESTLFKMASNTKPLVATAVLMLAEQGKLSLDDNVRRHLSAWDNYRAGYIKIRHLLSHTSGLRIPGVFVEPLLTKSDEHPGAPSLAAEVDRFGAIGADEVPSTTYSYNNPGYQTLGRLVEVAGGAPLAEFLRAQIYVPLEMDNSWNYESDAPQERMARVYRRRDGSWQTVWSPGDGPDWPFVRGSGGMISSARDYAAFCQMYLNQGVYGGRQILSAASVSAASRTQPAAANGSGGGYGLGWVVESSGSFGHSGSDGTYAWLDVERELIVLVFTQCQNGANPRRQFRDLVRAACSD